MKNCEIIFNHSLKEYKKKYRHRTQHLLFYSKKEVDNFDKLGELADKNFLLKGRKWWFTKEDQCYHEVPRAIRWTWFRNLNAGVQTLSSLLLVGAIGGAGYGTYYLLTQNKNSDVIKPYIDEEFKDEASVESFIVGDKSTTITLKANDSTKEIKSVTVKAGKDDLVENTDFTFDVPSQVVTISNESIKAHGNTITIKPTLGAKEEEVDPLPDYLTYEESGDDILIKVKRPSPLVTPTTPETMTIKSKYAIKDVGVKNVKGIATYGLGGLNTTKTIILEEGIETIGEGALYFSSSLESITLPSTINNIDEEAICANPKLKEIIVSEENSKYYNKKDGTDYKCLMDVDTNTLLAGTNNTTIPSTTVRIAPLAFGGLNELSSITIPASVTTIDDDAFSLATALTSITFENDSELTAIGDEAFSNTAFSSIDLPNGVATIGESAFEGNENLSSITIPNTVTSIGESVFSDCSSLATVIFESESQIASLPKYAFYNDTALTSIEIPASIQSIGDYAFYGCGLTSVTFAGTPSLSTIGEYAFNSLTANLTIEIPSSVTSIGEGAFSQDEFIEEGNSSISFATGTTITTIPMYAFKNSNFASFTIPESVTEIGRSAFEGCKNLTSIHIPANVVTLGVNAFQIDDSNLATVIIDSETVAADNNNTMCLFTGLTGEKKKTLKIKNIITSVCEFITTNYNGPTTEGEYNVYTQKTE